MKYTNIKSLAAILMLVFLAAIAVAQEDPLGPSSAAAMQDIRNTMGDDIFSPGQQDQKGNATPVITGKNLLDSLDRAVALEMYQSNDVVFGKGTIAVGSSLEKATATGTITGNKLNLDILSDDLTLFRLYLTMNGKSLSGDYHGYSISVVPWKGIAMGKIN